MASLILHDTLCGSKREFMPISESRVGLYVCGPTVYSYPHIGNARSVVVYDVLYRLLRSLYPEVVYVRNITDVDDKIIRAAFEQGRSVEELAGFYSDNFKADISRIFCISPAFEPKATDHIEQMIAMIAALIDRGNAYVSESGVYFKVASCPDYGRLSGRKVEDLLPGFRVDHSSKASSYDFALWKLDQANGWDSPWGKGRPGWHIECSAMSTQYLGEDFDIHGGGADLKFPHHENEIAQSCCANPSSKFAKYWVHNGFVTVGGEKMSKSKGNHLELHSLLERYPAEVIRFALMSTHYRKPMDWNDEVVENALKSLDKFYRAAAVAADDVGATDARSTAISTGFMEALLDDMNVPAALAILHDMCAKINSGGSSDLVEEFRGSCRFIGLLNTSADEWFGRTDDQVISTLIQNRAAAKKSGNYAEADRIRELLSAKGIVLQDGPKGSTSWYRKREIGHNKTPVR